MTFRFRLLAATALFGATLSGAAHANLLTNGGFEVPVVDPSPGFLNIGIMGEPAGFAWTVLTNNVDVFRNGVLGSSFLAFEGVQGLDLVGFGSTGELSQTFSTVVGQTYVLTFAYANNPISTGGASADLSIKDGLNSLLGASISHAASTTSDANWTSFSATFTATGTSATLDFLNTDGTNNGGILLDAVDIEVADAIASPEPATLGLLGVGLVALATRRRVNRTGG